MFNNCRWERVRFMFPILYLIQVFDVMKCFARKNNFEYSLHHGGSDYNLALFILSHPICDMVLTWKNRTRMKPFIANKVPIVYDSIFHCSHSNGKPYYSLCTLKFNHAIQSLSSTIELKILSEQKILFFLCN